MSEADLMSVIMERADRLAALSTAGQERALAELKASAGQVAVTYGLTEEEGRRLGQELVEVLRVAIARKRPVRVLH